MFWRLLHKDTGKRWCHWKVCNRLYFMWGWIVRLHWPICSEGCYTRTQVKDGVTERFCNRLYFMWGWIVRPTLTICSEGCYTRTQVKDGVTERCCNRLYFMWGMNCSDYIDYMFWRLLHKDTGKRWCHWKVCNRLYFMWGMNCTTTLTICSEGCYTRTQVKDGVTERSVIDYILCGGWIVRLHRLYVGRWKESVNTYI